MVFTVPLPNAVQLPLSQELEMCQQMLGIKGNKQICILKKKPLLFGMGPWDLTSGSLFH